MRRRSDRRAHAVLNALAEPHLGAVRSACPPALEIRKVTYVVDGSAYAWLLVLAGAGEPVILVGAETLPPEVSDPVEAVVADLRSSLNGLQTPPHQP